MMNSLRLLCLCTSLLSGAAYAADVCPASHLTPVIANQARHELESGKELVIVALGSSSTEGVMASTPAASYPAQLQADLQELLPKSHIAVINRGIGGEDAPEEMARMNADAIALRPALVIWQVGANGAMRAADPEVFRAMVTAGVQRMKAAGIDVVLMDNQRSPMVMASPVSGALDHALAEVARQNDVSLFSRGALMDEWNQEGSPYASFVSPDFVHHNDLGYHCVAAALANSLAQGLGRPPRDNARMAINAGHS